MTDHSRQIIRATLQVLHDVGLPHVQWLLYGAVASLVAPRPTLGDFESALGEAERQLWVIGITSKLGERKWAITDAGEIALRELS